MSKHKEFLYFYECVKSFRYSPDDRAKLLCDKCCLKFCLFSEALESCSWTCHMCTFHNHPDLNKCEQCEMPRMQTGSLGPSLLPTALPSA